MILPASQWWSPNPHTDLPRHWQQRWLRSWIPARIEAVDEDAGIAFLVAARHPASEGAEPEFFELELSREEIANAAHGFEWSEVKEGRFVELGYYGDDGIRRVGLHRKTQWRDPNLLPLAPPPDRWYRHAVNTAWASMGEA